VRRSLGGVLRAVVRTLARVLLFLALSALVAEVGLQAAAFFVHDRGLAWRPGAARRILCIGDSHTYGAGVRAEDAYPAQLQRQLDARSPGTFSVVNLGVPGMSTTQLRHRLPEQIARLRPDIVVVWCGSNDAWNRAEEEAQDAGWRRVAADALAHSRLYRFVSVWLHRRHLERDIAGQQFGDRVHFAQDRTRGPIDVVVDWGGAVERLEYRFGLRAADESATVARGNYDAMAETARELGVHMIWITYPLEVSSYVRALNGAIREVGERTGTPVVDAVPAYLRLPPGHRTLVFASHPGPAIYGEIAHDLADVVLTVVAGEQPGSGRPAASADQRTR
jgi:lysophospholipase L1-like esterase